MERLRAELDRLSAKLLPKSALAKAVTYALNQWQALCRYTEDGRLTIDNNASERRVRDQAIGRKNWLFLGSEQAGPRAAVIYTIIAGAKRHRIEPWAYLNDVILQLTVDASPDALERLMPDRWAAAHPEHVLNHRLDESREKARRRDQRVQSGAARSRAHETTKSRAWQLSSGRLAHGHLVISDAYKIASCFRRSILNSESPGRTSDLHCGLERGGPCRPPNPPAGP